MSVLPLSWQEQAAIVTLALAHEPRCSLFGDYKFRCQCAWCCHSRRVALNPIAQTGEVEALREAREAFLNFLADARDYHWEPDGDETGDHTTVHISSHWRQFEELALALGIKEPGYMETWPDAIDAALKAPPAREGET